MIRSVIIIPVLHTHRITFFLQISPPLKCPLYVCRLADLNSLPPSGFFATFGATLPPPRQIDKIFWSSLNTTKLNSHYHVSGYIV